MGILPLSDVIEYNYGVDIGASGIVEDADTVDLLSTLFLSPTHEPLLSFPSEETQMSLKELIDNCKMTLIRNNRKDNVFIQGYKMAAEGSVDSNLYSKSTHMSSAFLNTPSWRKIYSLIGKENMCDIFLNYSGFFKLKDSFVHVFGPTIAKKYNWVESAEAFFSLNSVLYRRMYQAKQLNPIPLSKVELMKEVFEKDIHGLQNRLKIAKRHKPFLSLCGTIIKNHQNLEYFQILFNICQEKQTFEDNLELALDKHDVIKFCMVVFDSIFAKRVYGSTHNKSQIFKCLSQLILGQKGTRINLQDCLKDIKVMEIKWLGKNYEGNINKQDFMKRQNLLKCFISWLFGTFFTKLLASFFHVTHISSSKELYFFFHKTWERISKPFTQKYISEYLVECEEFDIAVQSASTNRVNSRFRVMPKKANDFRVINTPEKGKTRSEFFNYMDKVKKEIRPAKRIVNQLRLSKPSKFPKVTSIAQAPKYITEFRERLLQKHEKIPQLYFLKFDVKACYDNIPQDKVSQILASLLCKEDVYYYCSLSKTDLKSSTTKQIGVLRNNANIANLIYTQSKKKTVFDIGETKVDAIRGEEVLNITKSQLDYSLTKIGRQFYSRKKGVFQGLHHSSLFCDILYDRLIDDKFQFLADTESIILRIADDFLIISTDASLTTRSRNLLANGIPEYGVKINKLKTVINFSSLGSHQESVGNIQFCGFRIDTFNLDIIKEFENGVLSSTFFKSHRKVVEKLLNIYKLRICYNTVDIRVNSFESILKQLAIITKSTAKSYCLCLKGLTLTLNGFEKFLMDLFYETLEVINKRYISKDQEVQIKTTIIKTFLEQLSKKNARFIEQIHFLKNQLNILLV